MVEADIRDDGAVRRTDGVSRVEPAAETGFQDYDVAALLGEPVQGQRGRELKLSAGLGHAARGRGELLCAHGEFIVGYVRAVNAHALVHAREMRRYVQPGAVSRRAQDGAQHGADAALSVRPGDMYEAQGVLRAPKAFKQLAYPLEARTRAQPGHALYVFQSRLIIHAAPPFTP